MLGRFVLSLVGITASAPGVVPLCAQSDTSSLLLRGSVRDPMRLPIPGVEVRVPGTAMITMTSDSGYFRLLVPRLSPLLLQFRRPGYRAQLLRFDGEWAGTVVLEPGTYELPEIEVTARLAKPAIYASTHKYDDFFRRQHLGFGEFITRDQIDRRYAQHSAQLLEGRAGIRVDFRRGEQASGGPGTGVTFLRCNGRPPKINVYVDGHKLQSRIGRGDMRGGEVGEMLERVNPSDIELMEIYRGPGELPGEFHDGNCGAIVIWTRSGAR